MLRSNDFGTFKLEKVVFKLDTSKNFSFRFFATTSSAADVGMLLQNVEKRLAMLNRL